VLSLGEARILELWVDEVGFDTFLDALREMCRQKSEYLLSEAPEGARRELDELAQYCGDQSSGFFISSEPKMPSSPQGRWVEMWRNAFRGLTNLRERTKLKISLVGLPSKNCGEAGLSPTTRPIIRRELREAIRIVELVTIPETSAANGGDPSIFADSANVRKAYAQVKEALRACDAARTAAP